jgi:hypothetical protein
MDKNDFHNWLVSQGACGDPLEWTRGKTLVETWNTLDSYDWMLWLMRRSINLSAASLKALLKEIALGRLGEAINRHAETAESIITLIGLVHMACMQFKGEGVCDIIRKHIPTITIGA